MAFFNNNQGGNSFFGFGNRNRANNNNMAFPNFGNRNQMQPQQTNQMPMNMGQQSPYQQQMQIDNRGRQNNQQQPGQMQQMPFQQQPEQSQQMPFQQQQGQMPMQHQSQRRRGMGPPPQPQMPQSDGMVSYEPIDEETMKEVQRIIEEKNARDAGVELKPKEEAISETKKPPESIEDTEDTGKKNEGNMFSSRRGREGLLGGRDNNSIEQEKRRQVIVDKENISVDTLGELIQNERNASEFYKILVAKTDYPLYIEIFEKISLECYECSKILNKIYRVKLGAEYTVLDNKINDKVNFKEGIIMAMEYENKAIKDLVRLLEKGLNENNYKIITKIINKKQSNFNSMVIVALDV